MRSTLLGSCLLALTFALVGCDDGMKKDGAAGTGAPSVNSPVGENKNGAMEPAKGGAMEPAKGGAMEPAPSSDAPKPETPK